MTIADQARAYEADALRYMATVEASIADGGMAWVSWTMASRRAAQARLVGLLFAIGGRS